MTYPLTPLVWGSDLSISNFIILHMFLKVSPPKTVANLQNSQLKVNTNHQHQQHPTSAKMNNHAPSFKKWWFALIPTFSLPGGLAWPSPPLWHHGRGHQLGASRGDLRRPHLDHLAADAGALHGWPPEPRPTDAGGVKKSNGEVFEVGERFFLFFFFRCPMISLVKNWTYDMLWYSYEGFRHDISKGLAIRELSLAIYMPAA